MCVGLPQKNLKSLDNLYFHNGYEFMTSEGISLSEIEFCAVKKGRLPEKPLL